MSDNAGPDRSADSAVQVWTDSGVAAPAALDDGELVFRCADERGPTSQRRLLWLQTRDHFCVSHLWFIRAVDEVCRQLRPGYVHDMVTQPGYQNRRYLRQLVDWARTHLPRSQWPYCTDQGLTVDGGPVAVRMGLIAAQDYRPDLPDRPTYEQLRGSTHLGHPGAASVRPTASGNGTP